MPPFTPFTGHVPPPTGLRVTPLGVPGNVSTPILRSFQPFQSQPSSTSEENRKRSIVRMNSTKPKRRQATQLQNEVSVSNPIINTDLAILLFPVSVHGCPPSIEHLVGDPRFNVDMGSFGLFAQRMFDTGLVFNIEFTEDELRQLPRWSLFDHKIMDGVSALPAKLHLPSRPLNTSSSVNTTLWSFVKCHAQAQRGHPGRRLYHLNPPAVPITPHTFTLETLIREFAMPNPISCPDDTPIPQHLIIIAPRFPGFVTGLLSSIEEAVVIPTSICRFGSHACFGYRILEDSFKGLNEILHSVTELCGTSDLPCPGQTPPSSPDQDSIPLLPAWAVSPKPKADTVITSADYLDSEEAINEWIARLKADEGISHGGPSTSSSRPKPTKRVRKASPANSQDLQAAVSVSTAICNARNAKKSRTPISSDAGDKGKALATGIIGLTPELPQAPIFSLPSIDTACWDTMQLWPKRISPNHLLTPRPCEQQSAIGMVLSAGTGGQLGALLLRLIEWMVEPQIIDLTCEEFGIMFQPPANTTVTPMGDQIPSNTLVLVAENTTYSVGEGIGQGPRRTAFQEAIRATVDIQGCWKEMGDTVVPDMSPVTDNRYWRITGALLALSLLAGENLHPISPIVIYALLSNVHPHPNARAPMDLSLSFVRQLQSSKADSLLPWMIIPPGQDWRSLPDGHRNLLREFITNLDLDSSGVSTQSINDHTQWTTVIVTTAMFGNPHFFDTAQFREMLQSFRKGIEKDDRWFLACKDLHTVAAIALELAQSSIRSVEDLWSSEKIEFVIHPQPQIMTRTVLEEIVVRSVEKYLERPGHVLLPDGMISTAEFEKERHNPLLRVRKLWEYWHGSPTLNNRTRRMVHINIEKLERPRGIDPRVPVPMVVNACFDKLEISINSALLEIMKSHLEQRERLGDEGGDTEFDCWIHGQVYQPEYNML